MCKNCSTRCKLLTLVLLVVVMLAISLGYYYYNNLPQTEKQSITEQKTLPAKTVTTKNRVTIELTKGELITEPNWRVDATSTIKVDGKVATQITSQNGQPVRLFRETDKNAYFLSQSSGVGGYILYEIEAGLYKLNLDTFELSDLSSNFYAFNDVSHNEDLLAWRKDENNLVLTDGVGNVKYTFAVDKKYEQFGMARFSPDDTKIAYSASIGYPDENERTAIFAVDIASGQQTKLIETTSHLEWVEFVEWVDNKTVKVKKTDYSKGDVEPAEEYVNLIVN